VFPSPPYLRTLDGISSTHEARTRDPRQGPNHVMAMDPWSWPGRSPSEPSARPSHRASDRHRIQSDHQRRETLWHCDMMSHPCGGVSGLCATDRAVHASFVSHPLPFSSGSAQVRSLWRREVTCSDCALHHPLVWTAAAKGRTGRPAHSHLPPTHKIIAQPHHVTQHSSSRSPHASYTQHKPSRASRAHGSAYHTQLSAQRM